MLWWLEIKKCVFACYFFNMNFSVFKLVHTFLGICMEGMVSQICDMGPSFYFMKCRSESFKK